MAFLHQNDLKYLLEMKIFKANFRSIKLVSQGWEYSREERMGICVFNKLPQLDSSVQESSRITEE